MKNVALRYFTIVMLGFFTGLGVAMACDYIADGSATQEKNLESPFGSPAPASSTTGSDSAGDLEQKND